LIRDDYDDETGFTSFECKIKNTINKIEIVLLENITMIDIDDTISVEE
jgi:hypothetical protein